MRFQPETLVANQLVRFIQHHHLFEGAACGILWYQTMIFNCLISTVSSFSITYSERDSNTFIDLPLGLKVQVITWWCFLNFDSLLLTVDVVIAAIRIIRVEQITHHYKQQTLLTHTKTDNCLKTNKKKENPKVCIPTYFLAKQTHSCLLALSVCYVFSRVVKCHKMQYSH